MTQTFDLKNMGFAEMQNEELETIDGGNFWKVLFVGLAVAVGIVATVSSLGAVAVFGAAVFAGTEAD